MDLALVLSSILCLTPIWATILWYIPIKSKWMYPISAIGMSIPTVLWAYNPLHLKAVTPWLHFHGIFFIVYIVVFGMKLKWTKWNKAASFTLFTLFIAGEWWEIPVFVYDFLGKIGVLDNCWTGSIIDNPWIFSHMRRIYTVAACILLGTLAKLKMTRMGWMFLGAGTIICTVLLLPCGIGIPSKFIYLGELARITSLCFTCIIVLEGFDAH